MTFKRVKIIMLTCFLAIGTLIIIAKCIPHASADPMGPPTIESYLISINSNMQFIKWGIGIVGTLLTLLIGALTYAYRRDIKSVNEKADKALEKADHIEETFMSISTHDRICHKH